MQVTLGLQCATRVAKGRPVSSPQKPIWRTRSAEKCVSQLPTTSLPVLLSQTSIMKSNYESPWSHHCQFITQLTSTCIDFISCSCLSCLYPNYFSNPSRLHTFSFFFFTKKGQTDQFSRRNSGLSNLFDALNSHVWVSLHLTVHSQKNVHIRHVRTRWKYCRWEENIVVGQKHCTGRCLQTSECLVSCWSDRRCHARLPEALWSLHLTSWKSYRCHHHVTCNTIPLHPGACVFFPLMH